MKLTLSAQVVDDYNSGSQRARVLTENWVDSAVYCPNCGHKTIEKYPPNRPVADFFCANCQEDFELKSKKGPMGRRIIDGAYRTMIERLGSESNPNLFLLDYNVESLIVRNFVVIPKHFFTPSIIERRRPLSQNARRAGWIGCNILYGEIPESGKIHFVQNGNAISKNKVLSDWKKTLFLRNVGGLSEKGWIIDIIKVIEKLGKQEFTLEEIYAFEEELSRQYPNNHHIKAKIRQQLQIIRDMGFLDFTTRGRYRRN
jgi:type II restriction enzyme